MALRPQFCSKLLLCTRIDMLWRLSRFQCLSIDGSGEISLDRQAFVSPFWCSLEVVLAASRPRLCSKLRFTPENGLAKSGSFWIGSLVASKAEIVLVCSPLVAPFTVGSCWQVVSLSQLV